MSEQTQHYVLKLIPSRPTFVMDMTEEERAIMQAHVVYWTKLMDKGIVVVFGPVFDPAGAYGLSVVEVSHEDEVIEIMKGDPAAAINTFEYYPMKAVKPARI
ncbi:YciI family protein [Dyadobacter diqingensis]|uniref:YciI family protein n=1 Tax=Dyadobacter diqingensis TaxID=2938121 RepID=UPI0020C4734D|nr:YciI family protein [Dyadobacter diqingensis]